MGAGDIQKIGHTVLGVFKHRPIRFVRLRIGCVDCRLPYEVTGSRPESNLRGFAHVP